MTIWDLIRALIRRWYVPLIGLVCAGLASYTVFTQTGVYYTRVQVTLLAPASDLYPNTLQTRSFDLVVTAGVIAKLVNGNAVEMKVADPAATLMGRGIRDGAVVRLPDTGGQWSRYYRTQALDVEVVGPDRQIVEDRKDALVAEIQRRLAEIQRGVDPQNRITTQVLPVTPDVVYQTGRSTRAVAMIGLLTLAATLAAVVILESWDRRRPFPEAAALAAARDPVAAGGLSGP